MITKKKAQFDYAVLKNLAFAYREKGKWEECLTCVETLCRIAYHLSFRFSDSEIEDLLSKSAEAVIPRNDFIPIEDVFVFYDCFAWDNRGLTQQYIRALISWNVKFLFILENDLTLQRSKDILDELKAYDKAEIFITPGNLQRTERIKLIAEKINEYRPSKAFLHMTPWDTVGVTIWNAFKQVTRYQVNLTDHAFWIGINCSDYIIEFRDYGYNLSLKHRNIDASKLLVVPYYPISDETEFQGFPTQEDGKKVKLFSGGAFYKIYGENGIFLKMMKRILDDNPETVIYFAGEGMRKPIDKFIKENRFEDRFFLIGYRKDISSVFRNIDIYLGTYPFCGGLMSQFAGVHKKPIAAYTDPSLSCNYIESLFPKLDVDFQLTNTDLTSFFATVRRLVHDETYRRDFGSKLFAGVMTETDFNELLRRTINSNCNFLNQREMNIDVDRFCNLYIGTENNFLHKYPSLFYKDAQKILFRKKPLLMIRRLILKWIYCDKAVLARKMLRICCRR